MELSNVLAFKPTIESQNDDNTGCNMERDFESTALVSNIDDYRKKETIPTKDLYPLSNELNQPLSSAFQLLDEGIQYISEAISFFIENDMFSSDDEVQKLQVLTGGLGSSDRKQGFISVKLPWVHVHAAACF